VFDYWRACVMGNLEHGIRLTEATAGYFYLADGKPIPLGQVHRDLLRAFESATLTTREHSAVSLYYGLFGHPLPMTSARAVSASGTARATTDFERRTNGIQKIARHMPMRESNTNFAHRPRVDPVEMAIASSPGDPWRTMRSAIQRALAYCSPDSGPARRAVESLVLGDKRFTKEVAAELGSDANRSRLSRAQRVRASAILEMAVWQVCNPPRQTKTRPSEGHEKLELVRHPAFEGLLDFAVAPADLVSTAEEVRSRLDNGDSAPGQVSLLVRIARSNEQHLSGPQVTRLANALTAIASQIRNYPLAVEWATLSTSVRPDDFTLASLVNMSIAATGDSLFGQARRALAEFERLNAAWTPPVGTVPHVERLEVNQQGLVATSAFGRRHAQALLRFGQHAEAKSVLRRSMQIGGESLAIAAKLFFDEPDREVQGKLGRHGGDLLWSWVLGALLRVTEPAALLSGLGEDFDGDATRLLDTVRSILAASESLDCTVQEAARRRAAATQLASLHSGGLKTVSLREHLKAVIET